MKTFKIYSSFNELPESWNNINVPDVFLQPHYFEALEHALPQNIQFFYVGIFIDEALVGVAVIQRVQLYLEDMFRNTASSYFKSALQSVLSKVLKGNILVVGNLMHTGQHAMFYQENNISHQDYLNLVYKALNLLKTQIKNTQKKTIRVILFKDFFDNDIYYNNKSFFKTNKLHHVVVQPNMIMPIKPEWLKIEDYVANLNKKYKARYKRAKKKLGTITCLELDLQSIKNNSKNLHQLYLNVSKNAKFNTFVLPQNHFYYLKKYLKHDFKVFGYYLQNELIGFYTLILNHNDLETYFLGYDANHQYSHQLYLNMLYDMAKFGIDNNFKHIIYARTAMEIKSSVGANPEDMSLYIKHTNGFVNAILKQVFKFMNPSQDWDMRHPFQP